MEESVFAGTIAQINRLFDEAEALNYKTYGEGCLACLTGYTIHFCFKTHYERVSIHWGRQSVAVTYSVPIVVWGYQYTCT